MENLLDMSPSCLTPLYYVVHVFVSRIKLRFQTAVAMTTTHTCVQEDL